MSLPPDETRAHLHWSEGTKYALEAGRSLILINGAAAAGILTFVGNNHLRSFQVYRAINMLAFGALLGAMFFGFGYAAQLQYGNRFLLGKRNRRLAMVWEICAYLAASFSATLFVWGMYTATRGLAKG